jgi:endonuclease YncB( thermonuclease family)
MTDAQADAEIAKRQQEVARDAQGLGGPRPPAAPSSRRPKAPVAAQPADAARAAFDMGQAYEKQGLPARAINSYQTVVDLASDGDLATKAAARIEALAPAGADAAARPYGDLLTPLQYAELRRSPRLPVLAILDGDEIQVYRDGSPVRVKLAGLSARNADAAGQARRPVDHLRALLKGQTVFLVPSPPAPGAAPPAPNAPVLAHVYRTSDGLWLNRSMAADGFGTAATDAPESMKKAEAQARKAQKGRWAVRK